MELGEKIRQARQAMGMSQRQLCGEEITRNMLSLIENGSARPSMDTLCYLAGRLEKPVSWFLDEQTVISPNQALMAQVRACYTKAEYAQALSLLESFRQPDEIFQNEYYLLSALCLMARAEQGLSQGKTVYAAALLEKAKEAGERSPYFTEALQRRWVLLMGSTGQSAVQTLITQLPPCTGELLLRAEAALNAGDAARAGTILDAADERNSRWQLLRGKAAVAQGDYETAVAYFREAEAAYPREAIPKLELCYRELEDYKMAYEYACRRREL